MAGPSAGGAGLGCSRPDCLLLTRSSALWTDAPPQASGAPARAGGPGNTAGIVPKSLATAREREGSLWLSSVTPSVLWYSQGKLMRIWRPVRKITASFILKDESQAE